LSRNLDKNPFLPKKPIFFSGGEHMSQPAKRTSRKKPLVFLTAILVSTLSLGSFAVHAFQSVNVPFEVEEPLEILEYPSGFSVYPGETVTFEFTVENYASVTYFVEFDFLLNDTDYQAKYVTFSNHNYSITPGVQELSAWLTVASNAPPANLVLTINKRTNAPSPSPSPSPSPTPFFNGSSVPSLQLLSGGARWAAPNGTTALYVNHKDNWAAHHLTDGADWGPYPSEPTMDNWRSSISGALEQAGFKVTFAGDVPESLNDYDLVVIKANWAVEPKHATLIEDYIATGGGVILLKCIPSYLSAYCKDLYPVKYGGTNLTAIQDWFGSDTYANTGGQAQVVVDRPFGTNLKYGDIVYSAINSAEACVTSLNENAKIIASWESPDCAYAFTYEYGQGRMYYQGEVLLPLSAGEQSQLEGNITEDEEFPYEPSPLQLSEDNTIRATFLIDYRWFAFRLVYNQTTETYSVYSLGELIAGQSSLKDTGELVAENMRGPAISTDGTYDPREINNWFKTKTIDNVTIVYYDGVKVLTVFSENSPSETIKVLSPENKTYNTPDVPLEYMVNQIFYTVTYSLDGQANQTITGNTVLNGLTEGSHSIVVYIESTPENITASKTIYFTISLANNETEIFTSQTESDVKTDSTSTNTKTETTGFCREGTMTTETVSLNLEVPFPIKLVVAPLASVIVLGAGLLVYFKKRKR
jgi:hypothetical protein